MRIEEMPETRDGLTLPQEKALALLRPLVLVSIFAVAALLYWPISGADFVGMVDRSQFHDFASLRAAQSWREIMSGDFFHWSNYYRPVVLAILAAEQILFGPKPGPMHLVSLGLHLANLALVGGVAWRFASRKAPGRDPFAVVALAMLVFAIHPALTEAIVSISCQFDLVATLFVLAGLWVNVTIRSRLPRAGVMGLMFFLAAGAKESAVVMPLLVVVADWTLSAPAEHSRAAFRRLLREQWLTYLAMFAAGVTYLALRAHVLGNLVNTAQTGTMGPLTRLQMVNWLYLTYWRILVWPMQGLGPIHEVATDMFARVSVQSALKNIGALAAAGFSIWLLWRRHALGALLASVAIALLPVLRIVPVDFDASMYHDRYAVLAIATGCAWLPAVLAQAAQYVSGMFVARFTLALAALAWVLVAAANVRVALPLWCDDIRLWRWSASQEPDSVMAKNFLLNAYVLHEQYVPAQPLADEISIVGRYCPICLISVANLQVKVGQLAKAKQSLERAEPLLKLVNQPRLRHGFETISGQLHAREGNRAAAREAFRRAIEIEPQDPNSHMNLAIVLAQDGRTAEARAEARKAVALMTPDERQENVEKFMRALAMAPPPTQVRPSAEK